MRGGANGDQLGTCHVRQSLSKAGVPTRGQQIVLPPHLRQGRLLGERSWQEQGLRKQSCFSSVISRLGWENRAVRWVP